MREDENLLNDLTSGEYKYGFTTDIETEVVPMGINEEIIRLISAKKEEPAWLLEFRLKAYRKWKTMEMPRWAHLDIPEIDYQKISYYAAPRKNAPGSLDEVDPELLKTFEKLGIPLEEQKALSGMAVDAVMDSVSVKTTFRDNLAELGVKDFMHAIRTGTPQNTPINLYRYTVLVNAIKDSMDTGKQVIPELKL